MKRGLTAEIERDALRVALHAAEAERDALKQAAGFKPGPFLDDLSRKVILDDIAGMRPAMAEARRHAADVQGTADLWSMYVVESRPGMLARVWDLYLAEQALREATEIRALQAEAMAGIHPKTIRHVKSCGVYAVISEDAQMQTNAPLADYAKVAVYRGEDGKLWVRPLSEMNDGRFVTVEAATDSTDSAEPPTAV